jgi:hypothetical protein
MTFVWQPSFSVDKHVAIAQKCLLAYVDVAIQIHLSRHQRVFIGCYNLTKMAEVRRKTLAWPADC